MFFNYILWSDKSLNLTFGNNIVMQLQQTNFVTMKFCHSDKKNILRPYFVMLYSTETVKFVRELTRLYVKPRKNCRTQKALKFTVLVSLRKKYLKCKAHTPGNILFFWFNTPLWRSLTFYWKKWQKKNGIVVFCTISLRIIS